MDQASSLPVFRPIGREVRSQVLGLLKSVRQQKRRDYLRRYRREHPMKRPSLTLDLPTFKKLQAAAAEHGVPLAAFLARAAESYVDHQSFPSKPVEAALREVFVELSRIGHNLNQWTRHLHASQKIGKAEIEEGKAKLHELREFLNTVREHPERFFKRPPQ